MKLKYWIVVTLAVLVLVSGFSIKLLSKSGIAPAFTPTGVLPKPTITPELPPFDPAYYGLPEVVAGYKILGVETSENNPCVHPGIFRFILQTSEPDMESFLKNTPGGTIQIELKKFNLKAERFEISIVGPGISQQDVLNSEKKLDPRTDTCFTW